MEATERHIKVSKTARYYQLGECNANTKRLWVVLHGYGQLASYFVRHFEGLVDEETTVVAPEGLSRFYLDGKWDRVGSTWMTKEDRLHEIEDYIGYLDGLIEGLLADRIVKPEIVLLGFSQGTATAWRWMMRGEVRPKQLILWAGGVAADAMDKAADRFADCGLQLVVGDQDQYVKMTDAETQLVALQRLQPAARLWTFEGDHRMDAEVLQKMVNNWAI